MQSAFAPYLSVVVTSRNDNHGGDLNQRTQIFINGLAQQAERFGLPLELIVVEWNPPAKTPPLRQALQWPQPSDWFQFRIITVPAEIHQRLAHHRKLSMYQMIAKNVGVRRARAPFVLATNVDILFSDELFAFLAERKLIKNCLYRCDRVDVDRSIPEALPIRLQLEYCRTHTLRAARQSGMWIQRPNCELRTIDRAVMISDLTAEELALLNLIMPVKLSFFERLRENPKLRKLGSSLLPQSVWSKALRFTGLNRRSSNKMNIIYHDPNEGWWLRSLLNFCSHSLSQALRKLEQGLNQNGDPNALARGVRNLRLGLRATYLQLRHTEFARTIISLPGHQELWWIAVKAVPQWLFDFLREIAVRPRWSTVKALTETNLLPDLHFNACGDFTLMDRDSWFRLRGSPEWQGFSMHLDSLTLVDAFRRGMEFINLTPNQVIYHLEHGGGWTPEGQVALYERIRQKRIPILTYQQFQHMAQRLLRFSEHSLSPITWGFAREQFAEWQPTLVARPAEGRMAQPTADLTSDLGYSINNKNLPLLETPGPSELPLPELR